MRFALLLPLLALSSPLANAVDAVGSWVNIPIPGIALTGSDNYGVQDILGDPNHPGDFYAFTCRYGAWKSTDYGLTWAKVSTDGGPLDQGKNWGEAMAPDGSYMLACSSAFSTLFKSTDGGVSWIPHATTVFPYDVDIDPGDPHHAIATGHGETHLIESLDAGETWIDQGAMGGASVSSYVHFLLDGNTVLAVSMGDSGGGTWRGVKSAGSWTWTQVSTQEHDHGSHQLFVDHGQGAVFDPGATPGLGIQKSIDNGVTWTSASTTAADVIIATATTLYAQRSFPNQGSFPPSLQHAPRVPGTSWTADTAPSGLINGAKRLASSYDGTHAIIVAGCWNLGVWRFVEPAVTDSPPTVVTAASASPATVSGTSTSLSVLGADAGGPSSLTYSWATTGTPSASVAFTPNGTASAHASTATFAAAGSYELQATITDSNGLSVTSQVTVTVAQSASTLRVAPAGTTIAPGGVAQFAGGVLDQFGDLLSIQPAIGWMVVGGGAIDSSGRFIAGASPGGPFTVTASSANLHGTAQVSIAQPMPAPTITAVTPARGGAGTVITITGTQLNGATSVTIGGVDAPFTVNSQGTVITTTVPAGAPSGSVSVTTPGGTATSSAPFSATDGGTEAPASSSSRKCGLGSWSVLLLGLAGWCFDGTRDRRTVWRPDGDNRR